MATNTTPVFAKSGSLTLVELSAANTNRDGTGTIVDGPTGVTAGLVVLGAQIKFTVSSTAGMIRAFIKKSGGSYRLYDEIPVTVVSVSGSVPAFQYFWTPPGECILSNGDILAFSTNNAEASKVWVVTDDLTA